MSGGDWVVDLGKRFAIGVGEGLLELFGKHEKPPVWPYEHRWTRLEGQVSNLPEFCLMCLRLRTEAPDRCEGPRTRAEVPR